VVKSSFYNKNSFLSSKGNDKHTVPKMLGNRRPAAAIVPQEAFLTKVHIELIGTDISLSSDFNIVSGNLKSSQNLIADMRGTLWVCKGAPRDKSKDSEAIDMYA
jgi:hypothetical protein